MSGVCSVCVGKGVVCMKSVLSRVCVCARGMCGMKGCVVCVKSVSLKGCKKGVFVFKDV